MNRKFKLDLFGVLLLVVLPGLMIWFRSQWLGIPVEQRGLALALLCALFMALFLMFSFDDSSRPAVAWRRVKHWVSKRVGWHPDADGGTLGVDRQRTKALKEDLKF